MATIENKAKVLGILWVFYRETDNEEWSDFFNWADLGLPLSYLVQSGLATLTDEGTETINETWNVFCEMIDIDPEGEYESLKEAFDASPNALLEDG